MADVNITPKISCDNCGVVVDKTHTGTPGDYRRPHQWGSCHIIGGVDQDAYGVKADLRLTDLCGECATDILNAAAEAAKARRGGA